MNITGIKPRLSENCLNTFSDIVVDENACTCVRDGRFPGYDYVIRGADFMPVYAVKQFEKANPKTGTKIEIKGGDWRSAQTTSFSVNLPDAKLKKSAGKYQYIVSDKDNTPIFGMVKIPYNGHVPDYSAMREDMENTENNAVVYGPEYVEKDDGTVVIVS